MNLFKIEDLVFGLAHSVEFQKAVGEQLRKAGCTLEQWKVIASVAVLDMAMQLAKSDRKVAEAMLTKYQSKNK